MKHDADRRIHARLSCQPPFTVSFVSNNGKVAAVAEDISVTGARLRVSAAPDNLPFIVQGEFDYTFHTDLGPAECRARTAWVQRKGSDFFWGVEFIKFTYGSQDNPLDMIIKDLGTKAM